MGKLYENIVSRGTTYRDDNEKILSAYDKMLMEESFTVIYRTGGTKNFKWKEVLPVATKKEAEKKKKELERMGYKSIIHKTKELRSIGLPDTYEGEEFDGDTLNEGKE